MKHIASRLLLALLVITAIGIALLGLKWAYDDSVWGAAATLSRADTVSTFFVGTGDYPSVYGWAYLRICRSEAPLRHFQKVFDSDNPVAKVYALGAFRDLDNRRYIQLLPKVRQMDSPIKVLTFDMGGLFTPAEAVEEWLDLAPMCGSNEAVPIPPRTICRYVDKPVPLSASIRMSLFGQRGWREWSEELEEWRRRDRGR